MLSPCSLGGVGVGSTLTLCAPVECIGAVGVENRSTETVGGEDSTVVVAVAIEALPRITSCNIEERLDAVYLLLVVHIEIEQGVALELLDVLMGTGTIVAPSVPCCR